MALTTRIESEATLIADLNAAIFAFAADFPLETVRQYANAAVNNLDWARKDALAVDIAHGRQPGPGDTWAPKQ